LAKSRTYAQACAKKRRIALIGAQALCDSRIEHRDIYDRFLHTQKLPILIVDISIGERIAGPIEMSFAPWRDSLKIRSTSWFAVSIPGGSVQNGAP